MDIQFLVHNTHLDDPHCFAERDPQLRRLKSQPYVYESRLIDELPRKIAGIYTLIGGRQVGKTTLLKQWMAKLLNDGVLPSRITFFSGELIDDHHRLLMMVQKQITDVSIKQIRYLLIDEVTYIKNWEKAVKYAADAGWLEKTILILTGSDSILIQQARMTFPGRRGEASKTNFHLYPLSFREFVELKVGCVEVEQITLDTLYSQFNLYLRHGGYLTAINDFEKNGFIHNATLMIYSDWIRGDMIKHGKQEHYLREIIQAIIKRYLSQVTWNVLARDLSIDHPKTVSDYIELLVSMDTVFIQAALLEDKLTSAPKKARKLMFMDPFIFHALNAWIEPMDNVYENHILQSINNPVLCGKIVEAIVVTHYQRYYPTYYIKAEGEVDLAYVEQNRFWPIEIKWTNQLRPKDLKQIGKYTNSKILTKSDQVREINKIKTEPILVALMKLK